MCRESAPKQVERSLEESILYLASQPGGHTLDYIAAQLSVPVKNIIGSVRTLLDSGEVVMDGGHLRIP